MGESDKWSLTEEGEDLAGAPSNHHGYTTFLSLEVRSSSSFHCQAFHMLSVPWMLALDSLYARRSSPTLELHRRAPCSHFLHCFFTFHYLIFTVWTWEDYEEHVLAVGTAVRSRRSFAENYSGKVAFFIFLFRFTFK